MRIVTLLPAATEIVALLAPESLVGVSHECDYPAWVTTLPRVTTTPIDPTAPSAVIDRQVRAAVEAGRPVIAVDAQTLKALRPELVITQGLCEVCAVADGEVHRLAAVLDPAPTIVSLNARTIDGILEDIGMVGRAIDEAGGGGKADKADEVIADLRSKLAQLRKQRPPRHPEGVAAPEEPVPSEARESARPRVVVVEWLDPLYTAGHWTPEMIELAGGMDVGAKAGEHSRRREWSEIAALNPDIILVALCGFSEERARQEWETALPSEAGSALSALPASVRLAFFDGNAYTSRPGPRVVEGVGKIRESIHG